VCEAVEVPLTDPERTLERIAAFETHFAKAQSSTVIDLPFGYALLHNDFPLTHSHNRVVVDSSVADSRASAAEVIAGTDDVLATAGVAHRYVSIDGLCDELTSALIADGYEHDIIATMVYGGAGLGPPRHPVAAVSLETRRPALVRDWRADIPDATDELLRQLADRTSLYELGAEVELLAVYEGDEIAARADLYLDRAGRVAQFESLVTHADYRGRGYGRALLASAIERAQAAAADLIFLTADLGDWPYHWYERAGFVEVTHVHHFSKAIA